ncbi:unnamed protein product [Cylicocyclus nassatus]|uniref:C-type lectin domain-containing protein n=1 Tax=Cylicocyclus nassatus TaxID=53992 RepID=A0AA36M9X4_CYLNA|nr:unnamed protein product [Cylicocyclus nassatus]
MFLFLAWIPLVNAFINPDSNALISKIADKYSGSFYPRCSNEACPGHCESKWTYFDQTDACYKTFYNANFHDAEYICSTVGGHLTSVHSYDENVFVAELAKMGKTWSDDYGLDLTWIGLRSYGTQSRNWTWTDGTKVDFLAWIPEAPVSGRDCALLYSDPYVKPEYGYYYQKWTSHHCVMARRAFVCKKRSLH